MGAPSHAGKSPHSWQIAGCTSFRRALETSPAAWWAREIAEIELIVKVVLEQLDRRVSPPRRDLARETIMVTAGGTREAIDPVRYLGNRSSGKMGYALAEAAAARGARVILISGISPLTPPPGVEFIQVTSSDEMRAAVLNRLSEVTIVIKAAAVSDYRPKTPAAQKIKRTGGDPARPGADRRHPCRSGCDATPRELW